jgi:hypothetical protein
MTEFQRSITKIENITTNVFVSLRSIDVLMAFLEGFLAEIASRNDAKMAGNSRQGRLFCTISGAKKECRVNKRRVRRVLHYAGRF